jgi:hypothetical protein
LGGCITRIFKTVLGKRQFTTGNVLKTVETRIVYIILHVIITYVYIYT